MRLFALLTISVFMLAACQQSTGLSKENIGTGAGALLGGLAGSQVGGGSGRLWATGAGALLGALVGSEVGASLDRADRAYLNQANQKARSAPIGETISWDNPRTGNRGVVTPVREGSTQSGRYCREFQQTIYVGGREETGYGTACRQPDGSWEIVDN